MALTTVTLPDGTAAVVHTEGIATTNVARHGGRAGLIKDVLHHVDTEAAVMGCTALRRASTVAANVTVEDKPYGLYAEVRVLCTAAECREMAEHCEKVGEPFVDAPAARAWALTKASADQEARDMVQERADAAVMDANLAVLRQSDPDADRLFRPGIFNAQLDASGRDIGLGAALEQYAAAKRDEGRMDRFGALFTGTTDNQEDAFLPAGAMTEDSR